MRQLISVHRDCERGVRSLPSAMFRIMVVALVVGSASRSLAALTSISELRFVPDVAVDFGSNVVVGPSKVAQDNLSGVAAINFGLLDGTQITGYEALATGEQLLSFDVPVTLPGGLTAGPGDVVRLNGATFTSEFPANGKLPPGVIVDGIARNGANLWLSFDSSVALNGGTLTVDDEDVVEFGSNTFAKVFDGSTQGINPTLDLDGVHRLSNGHLLVSFDGSGTVGGIAFDDEDVLEFTPGADVNAVGMWDGIAYNGATEHAGLAVADVKDIGIGASVATTATPTFTASPGPTFTPGGGVTPTSMSTVVPTATQTASRTSTPVPSPTPAPPPTVKEQATCEQMIATASATFFKAEIKALQGCARRKLKGKLGAAVDCRTESKTSSMLQAAVDKLHKTIAKKCGGTDKACGGNLSHESTGTILGWPAKCPALEFGASCQTDVSPTSCGGIADCLQCLGTGAADRLAGVAVPGVPAPVDRTITKCKQTLMDQALGFARKKASALRKCWAARAKGKHANDCTPPALGDGKIGKTIATAASKRDLAICSACGGPDKLCNGNGDLFAVIGFPGTCRDVKPPGANACGGGIGSLNAGVTCVGCESEYVVDCLDLVTEPQFSTVPSDCKP